MLAPHLAGSAAARQRFAREARAAAAVVSEHVVAIHDVESDSEPPFLVMQYVAGPPAQSDELDAGQQTCVELDELVDEADVLAASSQRVWDDETVP